ncbi:ROK family protein [Actinocorallia sp. A-T 12471]|uniref:ROK family protein n=1 Tax=Actinocorallia sp. A-T 12471 TaxID=3089813 RepID=UPI0029D2EE94|nr:ROK family protein [Actinocorallia sp. A-T 12471]MDX6740593.1 ROK family protein [Actinocorallia sp. A-T 12471]
MTTDAKAGLLAILRDGGARTRAELVEMTGLARSTVAGRLDVLLSERWIVPQREAVASGGRPATAFAFNPGAKLALSADLGVTHARLAVADLNAAIIAESSAEIAVVQGPRSVLGWVIETASELLSGLGRDLTDLCGVGVGLPGPAEHETGRPVSPPVMPGWNGFDVVRHLHDALGAPVLVDNEVNMMALGEHRATAPAVDQLMFVKHGTGIGGGVITDGQLHRGAQGAAGDIGHVRAASAPDDLVCACGNIGCLEALAGGAVLAGRLRELGENARGARDVARLVRAGHDDAVRLDRQAGRDVGEVLAGLVNFLNPTAIVLGGDLSRAGEHLLAGIRETVYRRSLPLATQHLQIRASGLGERAGVVGGAVMVVENALAGTSLG